MNTIKYTEGSFCWAELGTTDLVAAKKFYGNVLGWKFQDVPMGPNGVYAMAKSGETDSAALFELGKDQVKQGIPTHWGTYVWVKDVEQSFKKAQSLKAKVLAAPFDVMDAGRMAVIQDPSGATISLWQPKKHQGATTPMTTLGACCWFELMSTNVESAGKFYSDLFGWNYKLSNTTTEKYFEILKDGHAIGGMMEMPKEAKGAPSHWLNYFSVSDCEATVKKANSSGAQTLMPPREIPHVGKFSVLKDPTQGVFAVISMAPNYSSKSN